jgi:hypothetical protein
MLKNPICSTGSEKIVLEREIMRVRSHKSYRERNIRRTSAALSQ